MVGVVWFVCVKGFAGGGGMRKKKEAGNDVGLGLELGLGFSYFWFHSQLAHFMLRII